MKTIGLIGGMSWESTASYYRLINEGVRDRLGGLHSARMVMQSLNFEEVAQLQRMGDWDAAGRLLAQAGARLEAAGADMVLVCTNTMHKVAARIEEALRVPLLHIADPTADAVKAHGLQKIGLLGTRFTMEQSFYVDRLRSQGLAVVLPEAEEREQIHRVIFDELCQGQAREASRELYRQVMRRLADQGAQGVILGCTEIALLVGAQDCPVPLFDTTALHARAAVERSLS